MLTYDLSKRGKDSLYEYLYKCIKQDIISHSLKYGDKLPSKRALSQNLGISIITVQNAYEQLLYEGYIYSEEKKGYYVARIAEQILADTGENVVQEEKQANIKEYRYNFASNTSNGKVFPYSTWAKLMRRVLLDRERDISIKYDNKGAYELKEAIAKNIKEVKGLNVNPNNIIIGAGMEYLYIMLIQMLGDKKYIAVEDSGHAKMHAVYEVNDVQMEYVPIDAKGFNPEYIKNQNVAAIHISPNHHFPTGIVMPAERRHDIIAYARKHNIYIIEDDFDSEYRFDGRPIQSLASIDKERVIYMNTFSKTLHASLRVAYMVLPEALLRLYQDKLGFYACTVSIIEQYTLASFMNEGYYDRHLNRTRLYYKRCRENFLEAFYASKLSQIALIEENNAGLHFIIKMKQNLDKKAFIKRLDESGIKINAVSDFSRVERPEYDSRFIVNYYETEKAGLIDAYDEMYEVAVELIS